MQKVIQQSYQNENINYGGFHKLAACHLSTTATQTKAMFWVKNHFIWITRSKEGEANSFYQ